MINLSLNELKLVAKNRDIKEYEKKSEDNLIKILSETKPKKIKKHFNELRHKFSKSEISKIRKSVNDIENHRNLSAAEIRETEKSY